MSHEATVEELIERLDMDARFYSHAEVTVADVDKLKLLLEKCKSLEAALVETEKNAAKAWKAYFGLLNESYAAEEE